MAFGPLDICDPTRTWQPHGPGVTATRSRSGTCVVPDPAIWGRWGGESIVFAAEVTVTESNAENLGVVGEYVFMPNCFTFTGRWGVYRPGFPES
jgi:hypothetical protein